MNENQNYNSGTVTPYKATGNLNTAIGNPSVNINDTMNMNIQSMATNTVEQNNNQNISSNVQNTVNLNVLEQNIKPIVEDNAAQNKVQTNNIGSISNVHETTAQNTNYVTKNYVSTDNRPKKKTLKLNLGPEFKIVLLIMVILLVFVFILPILSEMFLGY